MSEKALKTQKVEKIKQIVVTIGAKGGAGKTLIMAHLARLLAMLGFALRVFDYEPVLGTGLARMYK